MVTSKNALVTGANKGIGFEICRQLGKVGFHVFLTARNSDRGMAASAMLQGEGFSVEFLQLDVTDEESIGAMTKKLSSSTDHLDVLVNNAGVLYDRYLSILDITPELLRKTLETNTFGPLFVTQRLWPLLAKSGAGRVLNVSSGLASLTRMGAYAPAYSISKTALNAVTRQFAAQLRSYGIAVNSFSPGWVRTEMGGFGATRPPEEAAASAVSILLNAPQDLTGQFLQNGQTVPW